MSKFISVKVFRGTLPNEERLGQFAGQPSTCFRVATEDDAHVKCFHVSEPPFNADHLEDPDRIKSLVFAFSHFVFCRQFSAKQFHFHISDTLGLRLVANTWATLGTALSVS